ncbi:hypothetical protein F5148DRAFT_1284250 [Russula earlei]|uniref:Uncharacterized protein n=1 Tax=Russula earlei TaxID=71964 RepID=A0ACC0UB15_9AGAM|nr:hypothetical protein F5148DRAFT_1284250 [Russula earlei]
MTKSPSWPSLPLILLLVQLIVVPVEAQVQAPDCSPDSMVHWGWTYNSLNQTPCETAAYLAAECNNGQFLIPQLASGNHYTGPSGSDATDMCECNSVFYSLLSACSGCQKGIWIPYGQWSENCSAVEPVSTYPRKISSATLVSAWAFLNVSDSQPWDNVTACAFGRNPESGGTYRPPFAPQFNAGNAFSLGVLVGAITGSTILTLIIVGGGVWYILKRIRRRRRWPITDPKYFSTRPLIAGQENGGGEGEVRTPEPDKKFYDPSDPSTYPDLQAFPQRTTHLEISTQYPTSVSTNLHHKHYSGLPEV